MSASRNVKGRMRKAETLSAGNASLELVRPTRGILRESLASRVQALDAETRAAIMKPSFSHSDEPDHVTHHSCARRGSHAGSDHPVGESRQARAWKVRVKCHEEDTRDLRLDPAGARR